MRASRSAVRRLALGVAALLLAAGVAAPFINAGRFAGRIQGALEQGLGRRVEIGKVTFNLFTGPGFTVENVVIHDDPAAGIEPLAYVGELNARVGMWSLLTGQLEFSTLRLTEPSVNLSKPDIGVWNLQSLLARAAATTRSAQVKPPQLQVRGGRFNFKFGDLKSVFYLSNADVDITYSPGQAEFRFSGEPARTDRGAQGFGRITGRGKWRPDRQPELELELNLERSNIGEIARLVHGHDVGLHGIVASRARLAGPLSDIQISGRLEIEDIHRWDLMPQRGQPWPLEYQGRIDIGSQVIEVETVPAKGVPAPVSVRLRASDILMQPRWATVVAVRDLPVANVIEAAHHFGAALPQQVQFEGRMEGAIGYAPESGVQGQFLALGVAASAPEAGSLKTERLRVEINRDLVRIAPFTVEIAPGRLAQVEGSFQTREQALDVRVSTRGLPVKDFRMVSEQMFGVPPMPLVQTCQDGTWRGWMRYRRAPETDPEWSAAVELHDLRLAVDGISGPVQVRSAGAQLDSGRLSITGLQAQAGTIRFQGEFRQSGSAARPDRLRLAAGEADLAEIERLFGPTLRRQGGFLARTLRLGGAATPDWLRARHAEATVEIGILSAGDLQWEDVRARLSWKGASVEVTELSAAGDEGSLKAKGAVLLASVPPVYRLEGELSGFRWKGSTIDVHGKAEFSGSGADLLGSVKSSGTLAASSLPLAEDLKCRFAKGRFEFSARRGEPELKLSDLVVGLGEETYRGNGATQGDGKLGIELTDGKRNLRLTGTLSPFALETERAILKP